VVNGLGLVWLTGGLAAQDKTERKPATENPLPSRIYTPLHLIEADRPSRD
jgi:hypothetical protein